MDCTQVEDLLGAYVLDALEDYERRQVEAHLAECDLHKEVRGLRQAAAMLAYAAPDEEPPARLRGSILDAIAREEVPTPAASPESRPEPQPAPAPIPLGVRRAAGSSRWTPWAVAAGFAVLAAGMFAWNVVLQTSDEGGDDVLVNFSEGEVGEGRIVRLGAEGLAFVTLALEPPPEGQTYQLWLINDGVATSAGIVSLNDEGETTVALPDGLIDTQAVAVSIEPPGGSDQPSNAPVLVAPLDGDDLSDADATTTAEAEQAAE